MSHTSNDDLHREDIHTNIVAALDRIAQAFRVSLWEITKRYQLSPIQIQIMVYVLSHEYEPITVSRLSQYFNLTPATISDAVKSLTNKSYLIRQVSEQDRRVAHLQLTPLGKATAKKLSTWSETVRTAIQQFEVEDCEPVFQFLLRLIQSLQESGLISPTRMCLTCRFFQTRGKDGESQYFCDLMKKPLRLRSLRIDCPDHQTL